MQPLLLEEALHSMQVVEEEVPLVLTGQRQSAEVAVAET